MGDDHSGSGTGVKLTRATVVVCGVASLVASVLSFLWVLLLSRALIPHSPRVLANTSSRVQINMAADVRSRIG